MDSSNPQRPAISPEQLRRPKLPQTGEQESIAETRVDEVAGVSRTELNFWLDTTMLVVLILLGTTAVIVQFIFPPGVAARGWTLWNMSYGQWCSIQFGLLSLLAVGVLVHVMLHWRWVCSVITRRLLHRTELPDDGIRTVYGVGLLIVILLTSAAFIVVAMMSIQEPLTQG